MKAIAPVSLPNLRALTPGLLLCGVIALSATFVSEHYGGPQLLYALLIGLAFHFLSLDSKIRPGLDFCGKTVLRTGVALLGLRITFSQVRALGWGTGVLIALGVASTIGLGLLLARWLSRPVNEGLISGCSVGICGASAALRRRWPCLRCCRRRPRTNASPCWLSSV